MLINNTDSDLTDAAIMSLPSAIRRCLRRCQLPPRPPPHRRQRGVGRRHRSAAGGAGRSDVRATAIKALSTLAGVTQTPTRVDGISAFEVAFPDGHNYLERVWLDAATGVPIQEKDGDNSATAYIVERVTAAHLPAAISPTSRLR